MTRRPDSNAGTRYANVLPVPVPASTTRRPRVCSATRYLAGHRDLFAPRREAGDRRAPADRRQRKCRRDRACATGTSPETAPARRRRARARGASSQRMCVYSPSCARADSRRRRQSVAAAKVCPPSMENALWRPGRGGARDVGSVGGNALRDGHVLRVHRRAVHDPQGVVDDLALRQHRRGHEANRFRSAPTRTVSRTSAINSVSTATSSSAARAPER